MRIQYPAGTKREWFDRNAVITNYVYANILTPHGATDRITHSIGTGRLAFCQLVNLMTQRVTAATTLDYISVSFNFSNGATYVVPCRLWYSDNTLQKPYMTNFVFDLYGKAGGTFKISTADSSTGGSVWYELQMSVVEFDA